jgi:hypothetical protein
MMTGASRPVLRPQQRPWNALIERKSAVGNALVSRKSAVGNALFDRVGAVGNALVAPGGNASAAGTSTTFAIPFNNSLRFSKNSLRRFKNFLRSVRHSALARQKKGPLFVPRKERGRVIRPEARSAGLFGPRSVYGPQQVEGRLRQLPSLGRCRTRTGFEIKSGYVNKEDTSHETDPAPRRRG